ncbi:hypothetical protein [Deinococcus hopiensis]|uniref:hypothetical protein n=1 Tax=Deinococcus hopiensis TaxID=309885 RepID=UPI00148380DC|nr:hypothetical protein [Deinococcus hopiensis]
MIDAVISSAHRAVLWSALTSLPVAWDAVPQAGVTLPGAFVSYTAMRRTAKWTI